MKKYKIISIALLSVLTLSVSAGCSGNSNVGTGDSSSVVVATEPNGNSGNNTVNNNSGNTVKNDGLAQNEVSGNPAEDVGANDTTFRLNKVIDSGTSEDGGHYIFLDVSISNATSTAYDLSVINNFYILLPDGSESHFDIRTQLYAGQNIDGYFPSPFSIPASGEFSGIIGGFVLPEDTQNFKVCFFPTLDDANNKTNVIKVDVSADNIEKIN